MWKYWPFRFGFVCVVDCGTDWLRSMMLYRVGDVVVSFFRRRVGKLLVCRRWWNVRSATTATLVRSTADDAGLIARYDVVGGLRPSPISCLPTRAPVSGDQIVAGIGALPCMLGPIHHRRAAVVAVDRCREWIVVVRQLLFARYFILFPIESFRGGRFATKLLSVVPWITAATGSRLSPPWTAFDLVVVAKSWFLFLSVFTSAVA